MAVFLNQRWHLEHTLRTLDIYALLQQAEHDRFLPADVCTSNFVGAAETCELWKPRELHQHNIY